MNIVLDQDDRGARRLTIESSSNDARLELRQTPDSGHEVGLYAVRLTVAGLQAQADVYFYGDDGLPQFVADLARDWRGWSGRREWNSLEGQLTLDAEHDGLGTVEMIAGLTPDAAFLPWRASAVLHVDPGALDGAAASVARFFRVSG